ncbi:hypothetical protein [Nonomuraea endophytica]|uniref:ParB/Sulfiredoxin domain-containing protein n=1 Tax=Nonomuraea endophytica TaxID=714136 RepID=A0A7W8AAK8_9ACTN|nr:hypothetical protein [Nonomuraea endophytica]MBB5082618.1 hypothetical protein [Nonomuraea endophytica]
MTTDSHRRTFIARALQAYEEAPAPKETLTLQLRGGTVLPVVEIPLEIPVLNQDSFRIAPQLDDHPACAQVRADPYSPESQVIIAQLVEEVHRYSDELKENLVQDGQQQAGLITRDGKLINGNTRCVLLRQLDREGRGSATTLKVAVLNDTLSNRELLEVEMLLQQQVELKDSYRLTNHLMMIKRLHEADMTDEQIARTLRLRASNGQTGAQRILERREILRLMERARRLVFPPMPMSVFASDDDKLQNWQELLKKVKATEQNVGTVAAEHLIANWLIAYLTGNSSVHKLRFATDSLIEDHVLHELGQYKERIIPQSADLPTVQAPPPTGISLLDDDDDIADDNHQTNPEVRALLNVVAQARQADQNSEILLSTGQRTPAADVLQEVGGRVRKGLDIEKRKNAAGDRLMRPSGHLNTAKVQLRDALRALEDVKGDSQFEASKESVLELIAEISSLIAELTSALNGVPVQRTLPNE